ncbi:MAG: hypothetical protein ACT4ON_02480 [Bacteroidota bacterium]
MKKYAIICSIFLFQAGYVSAQVKTNEKTTQPKNDKTNQTQDRNKTQGKNQTQDKNTQQRTGDQTSQLQTYDNFDGTKVVYYAAKTGTLDTLAENPAKGSMNNNTMEKNNSNRNNTDNTTGNNRNQTDNTMGNKNQTGNNKNNTDNTMGNKNQTDKNKNNPDNTMGDNRNQTDNTMGNNNNNMNKDKTNTDNRTGKNDNMNSTVGNTDNNTTASGKCAKYVRSGQQKYDYIKINLKDKLTDVNTFATYSGVAPKIKMKVYSTAPAGTLIEVQLGKKMNSAYPNGTNSQYQAYTTVTNAWEEIEFKFSQTPKGSETSTTDIDQITLMFNPNSSTSDTFYFDDLMGPALVSDKSVSVD